MIKGNLKLFNYLTVLKKKEIIKSIFAQTSQQEKADYNEIKRGLNSTPTFDHF